ncbi:SDR family NAD(P)-dependent oxidoreductase [Niveispirillum fermenti]|uniref:SDR family NAD(P)-dependent oxidoreductase n=1 Tax=Niveispirillum fermenti TaxID=1233113 RepID=UPI003A836531
MSCSIAVVGMACRYPDANNVAQFLENSLAQRRSFRAIPGTRLSSWYFDETGRSRDKAYTRQASLLRGFRFDRDRFKVPRSSYEVTDLTHWLALTVAQETLTGISFREGAPGLSGDRVRVIVGNTLTGEFSRAGLMRLRWPYVRGVLARHLDRLVPDGDEAARRQLLREIEADYKQSFPVPNEDSLAGGLANTIAGRICNYFDFHGGGYTVDGACASSLLAVADACSALAAGDADMVLAGGVDLSIDPFELIGFSRTAALARTEMRVYEERSEGFWPGEGCGFVALMRLDDAMGLCDRVHAVIRGWGVSSDGKGGLTRPESAGQALALERCYTRAGYDAASVGYFEGHGTGTKVGDAAELQAIIDTRLRSGATPVPAVISSVKANIGHTKAAAGLAGLLRAVACLSERVLPPLTACQRPHPLLDGAAAGLRVIRHPVPWYGTATPRRASVSAMGFGGINTHITLEEALPSSDMPAAATGTPPLGETDLERFNGAQDAELFLFAAFRLRDLAWTVNHLAEMAGNLSRAELTDLGIETIRRATRTSWAPWKAAIVAGTPAEMARKLRLLHDKLTQWDDDGRVIDPREGIFAAGQNVTGRIGLIFSGQAAPARRGYDAQWHRFEAVRQTYARSDLAALPAGTDTDFAQPAIVTASLAGLRLLRWLGIDGDVAVGHSLGELVALHWADGMDADALLRLARTRGRLMATDPGADGAMLAIAAGHDRVAALLAGEPGLHISNINTPAQTVIAGKGPAVEALADRLAHAGVPAKRLRLRQAFHTPAMAGVAERLRPELAALPQIPLLRPVISTVTAGLLPADTDIAAHLQAQIVQPVAFAAAVQQVADRVDLLIEVGPGDVFAALGRATTDIPVLSLDVGGESIAPFLGAVGAAFVLDRAREVGKLAADRFHRRINWYWVPDLLKNPCEEVLTQDMAPSGPDDDAPDGTAAPAPALDGPSSGGTLDRLRQIVSTSAGLPVWTIQGTSRLLSDLHLNSIKVGEILAHFTASLGLPATADPTRFVNSSLDEIVAFVETLSARDGNPGAEDGDTVPAGLDDWVRFFKPVRHPAPDPAGAPARPPGTWSLVGTVPSGLADLTGRLSETAGGNGVVVWLAGAEEETAGPLLLTAAHRCARQTRNAKHPAMLVVVQDGPSGGGFARSFHAENPHIPTLVITAADAGAGRLAELIIRDVMEMGDGFREIFIDRAGHREMEALEIIQPETAGRSPPLGPADVLLVSGGGKGISAECGYQLARDTGCGLLLLGRSTVDGSAELAANLARIRGAGIRVSYQVADVTDPAAVAAAIAGGTGELGAPVTGIIHGAGQNAPRSVEGLSDEHMAATLAPKIAGLRHLLAQVDRHALKLLVTFSSIIGRIGLHGEADYAFANEWLSRMTEDQQRALPGCRCRALEWSLWSGTGMGQRLGRVEALTSQGITPITIDAGIKAFMQSVEMADLPVRLVIAGRYGRTPTPASGRQRRFLERVRVFYPKVEIVADSDLTIDTDPYLEDHRISGERVLPAVMILEALAETATTLMDRADARLVFEAVRFNKAIIVPAADNPLTLRLVGLADGAGTVTLAVRCSTTRYQINHVEARCRLDARPADDEAPPPPVAAAILPGRTEAAMYDHLLFQTGRFRRIAAYHAVNARHCRCLLADIPVGSWFSDRVPPGGLIGDPGVRDAALHAVQACIPHRIMIPVMVERIDIGVLKPGSGPWSLWAQEIQTIGDVCVFDLVITDAHGQPVERWSRLSYKAISAVETSDLAALPLAVALLERLAAERRPDAFLSARITAGAGAPDAVTAGAIGRRPDGRPEPLQPDRHLSIAHDGPWRMAVSGRVPVGCDVQTVSVREPAMWRDLLGHQGFDLARQIAHERDEALEVAATRVWMGREAIKKAGRDWNTPLTLDVTPMAGAVILRAAGVEVLSLIVTEAPAGTLTGVAIAVTDDGKAAMG